MGSAYCQPEHGAGVVLVLLGGLVVNTPGGNRHGDNRANPNTNGAANQHSATVADGNLDAHPDSAAYGNGNAPANPDTNADAGTGRLGV